MHAFWLALVAWSALAAESPSSQAPPGPGESLPAPTIESLLETLRAVGPHGVGHREAASAWARLAKADASQLPSLLAALDGANPLAANWIRTAVDAVAERALRTGRPLPAAAFERFVLDTKHEPRARRLAYEWLVRVDPEARARIIPSMLNDPSLEMRRDAVARLIDQAASVRDTAQAVALYGQALAAARDLDQVTQIADRLRQLGQPIDVARQLGYIVHWKVIGPFDNTAGRGFAQVYPPEQEYQPDAVYQGKHGQVRWTDYVSHDDFGMVDFNKAFQEEKAVVGYAMTEFVSDKSRQVEIRMTSFNAPKLWVNGKLVAEYHVYHSGGQPDQYVNRVALVAGKNRILVKACHNELTADWAREWGFKLRVCDSLGTPVLSTDRPAPPVSGAEKKSAANGWFMPSRRVAGRSMSAGSQLSRSVVPKGSGMRGLDFLLPPFVLLADWRYFRGTQSTGESDAKGVPTAFAPGKNIAWKTALPGPGPSSPIVVGGLVMVTAASGPRQDRLHVLAFDVVTGKPRWQRQLWATGHVCHHPFGGVAASTPASDGQRVYALFSSNDLVAFDVEGNLQWIRGLAYESPTTRNDVGMASSPMVVGDMVVAQLECPGESFAHPLDAATGQTRWRGAREPTPSWTTPCVLRGKTPADDLVLLQSRSRISAHHPRTGAEVWSYAADCSTLSTAAVDGQTIFLPANGGIVALRYDAATRHVRPVWEERRLRCENASPVVHEGKVYTLKSPAILVCGEATTGKILWQFRLRGSIWATPAIADGLLYVVNQDGLVQVVRLGTEGQLAGTGQLDATTLASPAIADGAVYFRTRASLWKIAAPR
jgi:outer membrane protein assembly factor BamB